MVHGMHSITAQGTPVHASAFSFMDYNASMPMAGNGLTALPFCPIANNNVLSLHVKIRGIFGVMKKTTKPNKRRKEVLATLAQGAEIHLLSGKKEAMDAIDSSNAVMTVVMGNSHSALPH